ncbi:MAG: glycerate kinase, partial [Kordiimonadaceae bacterium]|nr:glycerate kinase [Kordiimonadaceae bacterium]
PNSEYLLSLALNLKGNKNIFALAVDTDGIDGSEDNAGAIITPNTLKDAQKIGLDLEAMLKNNDSYSAFLKLNSLILTGPTGTNVNDFRATLILPE